MDTRSMKILAAIVDEYIRTGEPVGSKALAEKPDISVSSATIRNTMAALEQEGYLDHPHTSAGRVPTYKGYRFYIDNLMDPIPLDQADKEQIDGLLEKAVHDSSSSPEEAIVESASAALAEITKCATYSTNHVSQFSVITKVDVIPTGRRMYVLLMITSTGAIKNRVCRMQFDLTNEQMEFFTNFVSKNLQGVNLAEMTDEYINKLTQALGAQPDRMSGVPGDGRYEVPGEQERAFSAAGQHVLGHQHKVRRRGQRGYVRNKQFKLCQRNVL